MKFYLAREGVAFGPYTEFQVRESLRLGIFEGSDLALAEDGKEWSTVVQLLPASKEEKENPAPREKPSVPAEIPPILTIKPARSNRWSYQHAGWAAAALFALCAAGGWMVFHHRTNTEQAVPKVNAVVKAPVQVVQPELSLRPPSDDMALPARENMAGAPSQASTVANPQTIPTDSTQKAVQPEVAVQAGPQHVIEGQINISARNGRTYEPASVEVRLYPISQLRPYLEKRALEANARYDELGEKLKAAESEKETMRKISDDAFNAYTSLDRDAPNRHEMELASADAKKAREKATNDYYSLRREREETLSGAFYLAGLPAALSIVQTDSQGKFRFNAPDDGEFALVAGTQRSDDGVERYYWFVPVNLAGEASKTIPLSNDNTTAHGSADSLVQTVD